MKVMKIMKFFRFFMPFMVSLWRSGQLLQNGARGGIDRGRIAQEPLVPFKRMRTIDALEVGPVHCKGPRVPASEGPVKPPSLRRENWPIARVKFSDV